MKASGIEPNVINTNEIMNDYEFYFKLYVLNQPFDFDETGGYVFSKVA